METLLTVVNALPDPVADVIIDKVEWIVFNSQTDLYSEFEEQFPNALMFHGKIFKKMSFNSDTLKVHYKETVENEVPLALTPIKKAKIGFRHA